MSSLKRCQYSWAIAKNVVQSFLLIPTVVAKRVGIYLSFHEEDLVESLSQKLAK